MVLALRWALRELRGGLRGFWIFLACLALGVAVIAGVGSVAASVAAGLGVNARALLGGDIELHLVHRTATDAELAFMRDSGAVSRVRRNARDGTQRRRQPGGIDRVARGRSGLSALWFGDARSADGARCRAGAARRDVGRGRGARPDRAPRLASRRCRSDRRRPLHVTRGAAAEPDASGGSFALGPPVMIAAAALPATGLVQPGSLIDYSYRLRLAPGTGEAAWISTLRNKFPEAGWRIREPGQAAPNSGAAARPRNAVPDIGWIDGAIGRRRWHRQRGARLSRHQDRDHRGDEEPRRAAPPGVRDLSDSDFDSRPRSASSSAWRWARRFRFSPCPSCRRRWCRRTPAFIRLIVS